ncbi:MAG: S8 family serine peptidase [Cyclobacteriaceae bacterium]|nr:S8 family serine peptidase [Cyclobacteriaceae bacterium]
MRVFKIIFVAITILQSYNLIAQQKYYSYVKGDKVSYTISNRIIIQYKNKGAQIHKNEEVLKLSSVKYTNLESVEGLTLMEFDNTSYEAIQSVLKSLSSNHEVTYASPVLLNDSGKEFGTFTNQVIVRLKSISDLPVLTTLLGKYKVRIEKRYEYDVKTYFLTLENGATKNAMEIANELHDSGLFQYVEPNFLLFVEMNTEDEHYEDQWALNNVNNHDMDVVEAWNLTTGCNDIRTAILDIGVELDHPDLENNLLQGFDATGGDSDGAPLDNTGDIAHGTACAGIVAAEGNNEIGVVGVAYNSRIIPIRIATRSANWTITESGFVAAGIDWAVLNGADVISMSFSVQQTNNIETAINNAVTTGRNNLGCILLAASGNSNTAISYPASNANVIAVGATTNQDTRASFSSFGAGLDVVAPGVDIFVTDRQGNIGYNTSNGTNGDYFSGFTGTSAACPNVAGVAVLVLSINPTLTSQQVRNIIESTANKVGGVTYTLGAGEQPGLTWNNQMGYGRVNAFNAVQATLPTITGPSVIACTGETFTLNNVPAGATVTWQASPGYFETNSGNGTNATLIPADLTIGGPGIVIFTISTACGNFQVQSNNFSVQGLLPGPIYFTNSENDGMYFCFSSYGNYFEIDTGAPGTNFEARLLDITGQTVLYTSPTTTYQAGTPNLWSYYPPSVGYYVFEVRGTNECGSTNWVGTEVEYVNCTWLFTVSPNPANNYLDIEMPDDIVTEAELYLITLVDYTGTEVLKTSSKNKKQRIDTAHLKNGQYVLRIQYKYNNEVTLRRIVIDR